MPFVEVNHVNLYYELHGDPSSLLLVLNNGLIMSAATSWVFQTQTLAQHYRLLQYDCRGQGQSAHPDEPYTMEAHADDLAALLYELGYPAAHIAGISYGGEVAQAFALRYPQMTESLVLADTVSEVNDKLRIVGFSWIDALRSGDGEVFFNATVPWNFSSSFIQANPGLLEDAKDRYKLLDFVAVIRLCECFLKVDFTAELSQISAPTCIIVGEEDILKGINYARIIHQHISHAELHILPGCGHASCWEKPAEFNSVILGFLGKL